MAGLAAILALALPLLAHHQFSTEFDSNKPLTLTGTIKSVDWSEPHVTFTLNVASGTSAGDWKLEGASPSSLTSQKWTQAMLKAGDNVTVQAYRALDNTMMASARSIRMPDGQLRSISDSREDGGPAPQLSLTSENRAGDNDLPRTASNLPMIGFLGSMALLAAYLVRRVRFANYSR